MPARLLPDMDRALADPGLISMREQYAVLDALIKQRLCDLGDRTPAQLWGELSELLAEFPASEGSEELVRWFEGLTQVVENGLGVERAEAEIRSLIREQIPLARQEVQREKALLEGITSRQLAVFLAVVTESIRSRVKDENVRRLIQADLVRAVG